MAVRQARQLERAARSQELEAGQDERLIYPRRSPLSGSYARDNKN